MDSAQDKDPPALRWQRFHYGFDLAKGFAGVQLHLRIVFALQQFQVSDGFETDNLVAAGSVNHQITGDGKEIGPACRHILPVFRGKGPRHDFGDHVLQFMRGGKYPPQTAPQRGFLRQYDCLEPFQLGANLMHVDPLDVSRASPALIYLS